MATEEALQTRPSGVLIHEAEGTIEKNSIFGNVGPGVEIAFKANPLLRANQIHGGGGMGVFVGQEGMGTLEENDVFDNAGDGVVIATGGLPLLKKNRIRDGKGDGVTIKEHSSGTLEENEICRNNLGIMISGGSSPRLIRNRIHSNLSFGVAAHDSSRVEMEENLVFSHPMAGITVSKGAVVTASRNLVNRNLQAIAILDGGGGTFEDNDLRDNLLSAWQVAAGSEGRVHQSRNQT